jgi:hypothetical protein
MVSRTRLIVLLAKVVVCAAGIAAEQRPEMYVERGACPFECCTYREWWASQPIPVYARPDPKAKRIRILSKGEHVRALTGFVRTRANQFLVTTDKGAYRRGDQLWVYTYHGEGNFLVWHKGRMYQENLGFSPYGGSLGTRGDVGPKSWGHLTSEHSSEWWIKLRLSNGRIGWTNRGEDFKNTDACG